MSEVEELRAHVEVLETHLARIEGIIHVMLEQIEAGTIEKVAPPSEKHFHESS
jgi:hypothetical protein